MNENACQQIQAKLVDYADGELPAEESARVTEHIVGCDRCRETWDALQRSLDLVGLIWQEGASNLTDVPMPVQPSRAVRFRRPAIAAGVVLLVIAGSLTWRWTAQRSRPEMPTAVSPTVADIERTVARAGAATGLVAAADYLAEQPGGREIATQRFEYVVQTYPETEAAAQARARLQMHPDTKGSS